MKFWILVLTYWVHLLATIIWIGGLASMLLMAWPALRQGTVASNQWITLQRRFIPWANGSLVVLLVTGLVQMTNDPNYNGFLALDSLWAGALFIKHLAFAGMVLIGAYTQSYLYPAIDRAELLAKKRPEPEDGDSLAKKELLLLRLNFLCAVVVLFFTAVATSV
jgi:uncharacterized membrane protein